jgi:hypothetical protein
MEQGHVQVDLIGLIRRRDNESSVILLSVSLCCLGDPEELGSIANVFCRTRSKPLLIGSVKSNMGHPEPAAGMAALAKLLISIQTGYLPSINPSFLSNILFAYSILIF